MAKKEPSIMTHRLLIRPMTNEEIRALMGKTENEDLRQAYDEMLSGCEANLVCAMEDKLKKGRYLYR